jgi:hypothetical protein
VGRAFLRNFITTTLTYRLHRPERSGSHDQSFGNYHLPAARVFNYYGHQGEAMGHVVCKLEARRGEDGVALLSPTCVCRKFAGDMSHCPSKLNNATKVLLRVFYFPSFKLNNEETHF